MPVSKLRMIITAAMLQWLILSGQGAADVQAATADMSGNNAEIVSISIIPDPSPAGTHPKIAAIVRNTSRLTNGNNGQAVFDVLAVMTFPNGSQKALSWHDVRFSANQKKAYPYGRDYDVRQAGTYAITYSVYNSGRSHRYATLSKTFTISRPTATKPSAPSSATMTPAPEKDKSVPPGKETDSNLARRLGEKAPQAPSGESREATADKRPAGPKIREERYYLGLGAFVNILNFSTGPAVTVWPLENLALQGAYGIGTFTSYEARVLYRFTSSRRLNPYVGAGYIHAERAATVLGVDTKIPGDSFTIFGGVELPIYRRLRAYMDISGTPMELKKDIASSTQQATGKVVYNPVTINAGFVFYLF